MSRDQPAAANRIGKNESESKARRVLASKVSPTVANENCPACKRGNSRSFWPFQKVKKYDYFDGAVVLNSRWGLGVPISIPFTCGLSAAPGVN